jgi:hypothetical protein
MIASLDERMRQWRANYAQNPRRCFLCDTAIPYEARSRNTRKFCNTSCAAKYNNPKHSKTHKSNRVNKRKVANCFDCGRSTANISGFCRKHQLHDDIINGRVTQRRCLIRWIIAQRGRKCELCLRTRWDAYDLIPLHLDHINGDASDNYPSNLRMLCPNCHDLQPTSRGKNRGNGRKARGLPVH